MSRSHSPELEFWLFPPQGDSEEARFERGAMVKEIIDEVVCMDLMTIQQVPEIEDLDAIAILGTEMVRGLGAFHASNGGWRDEGLCLLAVCAEAGDRFASETLAHEISREIGFCVAETLETRIPPEWIRPLSRRVVNLLSGTTLQPHSMPALGTNGTDVIWMSGIKWDGRGLHERVLPLIRHAFDNAAPELDEDLRMELSKVIQGRCCLPDTMHAAATMLTSGKGDGCINNPGRLARLLHYGAACLGDRASMLAMVEYLLIESQKPCHGPAIEEIYSQLHGWFELACTDFKRFADGGIGETIRDMAAVKLSISRGPLAAVNLVGNGTMTSTPSLGRVSLTPFNHNPDADHPNREIEQEVVAQVDPYDDLEDPIVANAALAEREKLAHAKKMMGLVNAPQKRGAVAPPPSASPLTLSVIRSLESASKAMQELYAPLLQPLPLVASPDPEAIRKALLLEFPWFEAPINMVCDDLWQRRSLGDPSVRFRPILIHGGAGIGKTTFASRLAQLLGTPAMSLPAAGSNSSQMLKGLSKGYNGAHPSGLVEFILRRRIANPLAIVDEVDKVGEGSLNGNLIHTLLSLLERQSAQAWMDECLCTEVDLSRVSWILTANKVEHLPGPLLSRVRMFEVPKPKAEHFFPLYHGILTQLANEAGVPREFLPQLDELELDVLQSSFAKNPTARSLRSKIERLIGLRSMRVPPGRALN